MKKRKNIIIKELNDKNNWIDYKNTIKLKKELSALNKKNRNIKIVKRDIDDIKEISNIYLKDIKDTNNISQELSEIEENILFLEIKLKNIELINLLNQKNDILNAYLD